VLYVIRRMRLDWVHADEALRSPGDISSHPQDHLAQALTSPPLPLQCR
jgi:hypothetical protein